MYPRYTYIHIDEAREVFAYRRVYNAFRADEKLTEISRIITIFPRSRTKSFLLFTCHNECQKSHVLIKYINILKMAILRVARALTYYYYSLFLSLSSARRRRCANGLPISPRVRNN